MVTGVGAGVGVAVGAGVGVGVGLTFPPAPVVELWPKPEQISANVVAIQTKRTREGELILLLG